ncbi:hypothetical protein Clacol_008370 [Clathrus columnatus]|uniref:Glycosyltransferase family 17 protein n=1 Tax=Clathrus columnatus TaxID=1419009 RepID=A0AAV5AN60_9AGAM|nr:hypothetical protein Clacol_008370 [Clathrus columnatus]
MFHRLVQKPRFFVILLAFIAFTLIFRNRFALRNTLSYATRPLWDKQPGPSQIIPHYYGENIPANAHLCSLHGWKTRSDHTETVIFDAMLMNNEVDLLEIRLNELDDVVDYFVILESNATFTGLPKSMYFEENKERYSKFSHKILYQFFPGYPPLPGKTAWDNEAHTRNTMSKFLRSYILDHASDATNIVIMSDVDEIPSRHTLSLLKACDFGNSLHLQLRAYLYSWRASAQIWGPKNYVLKMKGYSHSDRLNGQSQLLEPEHIQDTICKGKDIFGMLPETYNVELSEQYLEMLSQMNPTPCVI